MAGGVAIVSGGKEFEGKMTSYVILASLVAASGGLLFGYDVGVTGGVTTMPDFLNLFFPEVLAGEATASQNAWCKYDNQLLQLFTSSLFIAGMFAGLAASYTTSRLGRVRTMLIAGICFLIGAALCAGAVNTAMLVIGRVMLGCGVGCANQSVPLYLSEVAPAKARGALNIMFQMATTIGIVAGQLINYGTQYIHPWGWRLSLGLAAVPAIMLTIGGIFLPETPNNLVERGHLNRGREVLQRLRGEGVDVEPEFSHIVLASEASAAMKGKHFTIFKKDHSPQLTWAILIPAFQQLTGINAIMFYSTPLFSSLGLGQSASLISAVIIGAVNVVATVISIVTVDRLGRRALFISGGVMMLVMQVIVAALLGVYFGDGTEVLPGPVSSAVIAIICLYVAGFAISWGPLGWLVPSEIQPLETRSTGQAITVAVNFLFTFIIGQAFLSMLCKMEFGIFLFFAAWVIVMTLAVFFFLPETKGVLIEDMTAVWSRHWFWKRLCGPPETDVEATKGMRSDGAYGVDDPNAVGTTKESQHGYGKEEGTY